MKHRHVIAAIFLLAGLLLGCLPVFYALHQARQQAIGDKYKELDDVAQGLDRRVRNALAMLAAAPSAGSQEQG